MPVNKATFGPVLRQSYSLFGFPFFVALVSQNLLICGAWTGKPKEFAGFLFAE
jgi:hypothetical protein